MPDSDGRLNFREQDEVKYWVSNHGPLLTCPVCSRAAWAVAEYLIDMRNVNGANYSGQSVSYPAALVVCDNCGYTMYFNAVRIGLVRGDSALGEVPHA
jgi:hypothetical protein